MSLFDSLTSVKNWELQYSLLIDAGKKLNTLPESERKPEYRISGCNAPTWLKITLQHEKVSINGYSKSHVVLGLIALLSEYCQSHTLDDIARLTVTDFSLLRLEDLITVTRQNGFSRMISALSNFAQKYAR